MELGFLCIMRDQNPLPDQESSIHPDFSLWYISCQVNSLVPVSQLRLDEHCVPWSPVEFPKKSTGFRAIFCLPWKPAIARHFQQDNPLPDTLCRDMVLQATQKEPMYKLGILLYDATKERGRNVENV